MPAPENSPIKLISVPNELEAAMIVSALAASEVDATTAGSFTSGFRAEAPGEVQVLVRESDLAQARRALQEIQQDQPANAGAAAMVTPAISLLTLLKVLILFLLVCGLLLSLF